MACSTSRGNDTFSTMKLGVPKRNFVGRYSYVDERSGMSQILDGASHRVPIACGIGYELVKRSISDLTHLLDAVEESVRHVVASPK